MTNYFILKDSNGIMQESADTFQEALSKKTATTAVIENTVAIAVTITSSL